VIRARTPRIRGRSARTCRDYPRRSALSIRVRVAFGLLALSAPLGGCGPTVTRTLVITATPARSLRATATPDRNLHHGAQRPRASPTAVSGPAIVLAGLTADPPTVPPGGTVTLGYSVMNRAAIAQSVVLGATAYSERFSQNSFSDSSNDARVTLEPGAHVYQRRFSFPVAASGQVFDMLVSIATPSFSKAYVEKRFTALVAVAALPTPQATPTSVPNGAYEDYQTGMRVRLSHFQTDSQGGQFVHPAPGYLWALLYAQVWNDGTQPHDYNRLDFQAVDQAGQTFSASVYLTDRPELDSGNLPAGELRAGWIGFEVPVSTQRLLLTWDDSNTLSPPAEIGHYTVNG